MNENEQDHVSDSTENTSENASGDKEESYKIVIQKDGEEFEVGTFGSSAEITVSEEQFNQLLKSIENSKTEEKKIDSIITSLRDISASMEAERKSEERTREGTTEVPEDYYSVTTDFLGQISFFSSLIFGLFVSFLFCYGLKK